MRKKLWGENRHPERWTGSRNLLFDIEEVDRFLGAVIQAGIGKTLKEFYETEYRRLNWYIHGSGVAGYWNMPTRVFNLLCAAGYNMACDFGMLCVRIILTDYGFTSHLPDLENEWRKVRVARGIAFLESNSQFQSQETRHALEVAKQILYPDSKRID
jgi:hypothetical protein